MHKEWLSVESLILFIIVSIFFHQWTLNILASWLVFHNHLVPMCWIWHLEWSCENGFEEFQELDKEDQREFKKFISDLWVWFVLGEGSTIIKVHIKLISPICTYTKRKGRKKDFGVNQGYNPDLHLRKNNGASWGYNPDSHQTLVLGKNAKGKWCGSGL